MSKSKSSKQIRGWRTCERAYIHCVDSTGKPFVVCGHIVGERNGFIDFVQRGTHVDLYIHRRFVFGTWFAAWRRARAAARRFRASARNGLVTTRPNGVNKDTLCREVPTKQVRSSRGKEEKRLISVRLERVQ